MTENYTGQKAQTQKEPRRWERRPAEQAGKGGEQAAGEASSRKKPQPTASFPSPPRSPLLRLGLQLQAYTNGALIATGNLSGRGGGELGKPPPLGPRLHPPLLAPYPVPAPILPGSFFTPLLWAPSLIHTSLLSSAAPSSRDPLSLLSFRWDS